MPHNYSATRRAHLRQELISYIETPTEQQFVTVNGNQTCYLKGGSGEPVILLHGANSDATLWYPVMGILADYFSVFAPDLIGYGESDKPHAPYDRQFYGKWLYGFIHELGLHHERIRLVGLSKGGVVALQFALEYGKLVDRMVLVGSGGLGKLRILGGLALAFTEFHAYPTERTQALVTKYSNPANMDEKKLNLRRYRLEVVRGPGGNRVYFKSAHKIAEPLPDNLLHKIKTPSLLIWGDNDYLFPLSVPLRAVNVLPNADLTVIEGSGHVPFWEKPEEFNSILLNYLLKPEI